jgi:methionyl-tRNA formyltransferase
MGTPEFAVASLDALVNAGCNVVGVITAPDKPAGRGMKLQESAVKKYAVEKGLHVLQPEKLKNADFLEELRSLKADLQVVVAFRMLPEVVWNMPPMGTINVHGSLLPEYRGAAPINWAIINGEKETGVTTFKLKHEIDTGDILLQEKIPIGEDETAGELHDRMKEVGADLLVRTIKGLTDGSLKETPQSSMNETSIVNPRLRDAVGQGQSLIEDASKSNSVEVARTESTSIHDSRLTIHDLHDLKHAPKIFTDTCKIDWNKPVGEVHNLVRGLSPFPGAFTYLDEKMLKIYRSEKQIQKPAIAAGKFETDGKNFLKFAAADGYLLAKELQLEGKKRMTIGDFLRGYRFHDDHSSTSI